MAERFDLHHPEVAHLLQWVQCGVVSRRQLKSYGATDSDIARLRRRKQLTQAHPGVYVNHSGPLTYAQREWVAVLAAWPAALTRESALPGRRPDVIQVAVERGRTVQVPKGAVVRRTSGLAAKVSPRSMPPRLRIEHAVIEVMARRLESGDVAGAFADLARACFGRRTSPEAVLDVLGARPRITGRATIEGLLTDLRDGACSVLERGYLHRVERAHGLPQATRQARSTATGTKTDQDVRYDDYGLIVELDGRSFHDSPEAYDADARRDLAEKAANAAETVRVTYGLVFREPCRTARWLAAILRRLGWTGQMRRCPDCAS